MLYKLLKIFQFIETELSIGSVHFAGPERLQNADTKEMSIRPPVRHCWVHSDPSPSPTAIAPPSAAAVPSATSSVGPSPSATLAETPQKAAAAGNVTSCNRKVLKPTVALIPFLGRPCVSEPSVWRVCGKILGYDPIGNLFGVEPTASFRLWTAVKTNFEVAGDCLWWPLFVHAEIPISPCLSVKD